MEQPSREWLQVLISADLKQELRVKAVQDRENLTTAIEALIRLYVSGQIEPLFAKETKKHADPH